MGKTIEKLENHWKTHGKIMGKWQEKHEKQEFSLWETLKTSEPLWFDDQLSWCRTPITATNYGFCW